MKKVILGMLSVLSLTCGAAANARDIEGVYDTGAPIVDTKNTYYVVHGGCRAYNNNPSLTEVWIYLSMRPNVEYRVEDIAQTTIQYDPNNSEIIRATMYLTHPKLFNQDSAIETCNYLRAARNQQFPVKMALQPDPRWASVGIQLIKSVDGSGLCSWGVCAGYTEDPVYLENFSVTPENRGN